MIALWYFLISFMLITYGVLDGRNFGVGLLHGFVAKTPQERRQVVAAIGPLWTWHEVWLVGFGGTVFAVFPELLATAFAGYYLALFLILWCLILRGISLELGGHLDDPMWQGFWDFVLVASSGLLSILFGAAAGNLVRGVPINAEGDFSMAFFTDFHIRGNVGILDWYTISIALFATVMLAAHGANYLVLKTEGPVQMRSARLARLLWILAIPLFVIISAEGWYVRPSLLDIALHRPLCWLGIAVILGSIWILFQGLWSANEKKAFWGGNFLIVGLMATGAAAFFPVLLYSTLGEANSLTAGAASAGHGSLMMALIWWPFGLALSVVYFIFISRRYAGKVSIPKSH